MFIALFLAVYATFGINKVASTGHLDFWFQALNGIANTRFKEAHTLVSSDVTSIIECAMACVDEPVCQFFSVERLGNGN